MGNNQKENTKRKKKGKRGNAVLRVIATVFLIGLITLAMIACMAVMYVKYIILPDVSLELADVHLNLTSTIYYYDENGEKKELRQLHGDENRIWVSYDELPEDLINATIAIEDKRFEKHNGVDWLRTANGVLRMFTGQDIQGGSTLTQQLIKNLTKDDQVTVKRKIKEIFRALDFEDKHEKKEILEWYLNYIYLGENCNGVSTAAFVYFGKDVSDLSLAECASLIGITNNPSKYNPYRDREANRNRQLTILAVMLEQKYITEQEHDAAVAEELHFLRGEDETAEFNPYSWYVDAVIEEVIEALVKERGYSEEAATMLVYSGGLQIESCYNPKVQSAVDAIYLDRANLDYVSATGLPMQSAITVIDNSNGKIVAMAGGVGAKTGSRMFNRASQTVRPPGSSIKPLSVYAPALEMGFITPSSIAYDKPDETGWPVNSYGSYRGAMSIREALRVSSNCVAVAVLRDYVTPQVSYDFMKSVYEIELVNAITKGGKTYSDIDLAPLALGGLTNGVSTKQMAAAFSVFPRNGVFYTPSTYFRVLDSNGVEILTNEGAGKAVLKEKTTFYMTEMLKGVVSGGTGRDANFSGQEIAGKTGTTSSRKDLWFVGYTPYYTAAVWTGYDRQERVAGSGNPSVVLFRKVMQKAHEGLPYQEFSKPNPGDMVTIQVCSVSGKLPNEWCAGHVISSTYFKDDVPTTVCTVHKEPIPFDPENPESYPVDDPNFNIGDPTTWPGYQPPVEPDPTEPAPPTPDPPAEPDPPEEPPEQP